MLKNGLLSIKGFKFNARSCASRFRPVMRLVTIKPALGLHVKGFSPAKAVNNKGIDQTARLHRQSGAFVFHICKQ